jgi:hypothetical protein
MWKKFLTIYIWTEKQGLDFKHNLEQNKKLWRVLKGGEKADINKAFRNYRFTPNLERRCGQFQNIMKFGTS